MSRVSIDDIYEFPDPVIGFDFNFLVPNPPGGGSGKALNVKCKSLSLPGTTIEVVDVPLRGFNLKRAGRRTWTGEINVTLLETTDFSSRETVLRWINLARDARTQKGVQSSVYATTGTIQVLDAAGNPIREARCERAWFGAMNDVDLNGDGSTAMELAATLHYDIVTEV